MPLPNLNSLGYTGLKEVDPPNIWKRDRDPVSTDFKLYDIGDLWYNIRSFDFFILIAKEASVATWQNLAIGTGLLDALTINGGATTVFPVGAEIDFTSGNASLAITSTGAGNITLTVSPTAGALDTLSINMGGTVITPVLDNIDFVASGGIVLTSPLAGRIQIAAAGISSWIETAVSIPAALNTGYIANGGALVNLSLPAIAPQGSIVRVAGKGVGLWQLTANAGQTIFYGSLSTVVAGNLAAFNQRDTVEVLCTTANTEWTVLSSIGNLIVT